MKSRGGFRGLDVERLKISIDLDGYEEGQESIAITERNLKLPARLSVYRIDPGIVRVGLIPRRRDTNGKPADALPP
jgi:hypothetical protein